MKTFTSQQKPNKPIVKMLFSATLRDLTFALKNISRGKDFLVALIGHKNFNKLLQKETSRSQDSHLRADTEEKFGSAMRVITTVVTSGLGIWLGILDFMIPGYRSLSQFIIVSVISIAAGMVIGILSYGFAANKAKEAVLQMKTIKLQLDVINKMIEIVKARLNKTKPNFLDDIRKFNSHTNELEFLFNEEAQNSDGNIKIRALSRLFNEIEEKLAKHDRQDLLSTYIINAHLKSLKVIIKKLIKEYSSKKEKNAKKNDYQLIFQSTPRFPKRKLTIFSWVIESSMRIFLETVPVLIGSFAAIFLLLNGLPDTFKKLGYVNYISLLSQPWIKWGGFAIMVLYVIYLAGSQVKFSYKSFTREKEIEETKEKASIKEAEYFYLHRRYALIKKLSGTIHELLTITSMQ